MLTRRPVPTSTPARRAPLLGRVALALAIAGVLAGCTTFTDNAVAVRVGDATLERDELDAILVSSTPGAQPGERVEVPLGAAQARLNTWILTEVLRGELDAAGVTITDADREQAVADIEGASGAGWSDATPEPLRSLQVEQQAVLTAWTALPLDDPSQDELRRAYLRGPQESGIACTAHILVETEAEARQVVADLAAGADFATLAAERSTDPGSAAQGGVLPCSNVNQFAQTFIAEFVEGAFAATVGEPTDPVASQFGYHVILLRPFEDLADEDLVGIYQSDVVRFRRAARAADVRVDPRYGAFDPDAGVVTLGTR